MANISTVKEILLDTLKETESLKGINIISQYPFSKHDTSRKTIAVSSSAKALDNAFVGNYVGGAGGNLAYVGLLEDICFDFVLFSPESALSCMQMYDELSSALFFLKGYLFYGITCGLPEYDESLKGYTLSVQAMTRQLVCYDEKSV